MKGRIKDDVCSIFIRMIDAYASHVAYNFYEHILRFFIPGKPQAKECLPASLIIFGKMLIDLIKKFADFLLARLQIISIFKRSLCVMDLNTNCYLFPTQKHPEQ
jgi:hypothetical protein